MANEINQDWNNATWLGSRRVMIKRSLKLTVRERLQALEEMNKTSRTLASLKKKPNSKAL